MSAKLFPASVIVFGLLAGCSSRTATLNKFTFPVAPKEAYQAVKQDLHNREFDPANRNVTAFGPSYQVYEVNLSKSKTLNPRSKDAVISIIAYPYWEYLL